MEKTCETQCRTKQKLGLLGLWDPFSFIGLVYEGPNPSSKKQTS